MTESTTLRIVVSSDKKVNMDMEGRTLHPVEVCKILNMLCGQLLGAFQVPEPSKIIKPEMAVK